MQKTTLVFIFIILFTAFGCQKDDNVSQDEDLSSQGFNSNTISRSDVFILPVSALSDPVNYVKPRANQTDDGKETYGSVTFENGIAYLNAPIEPGTPKVFEECEIKTIRTIICGKWDENPSTTICALMYVAECDLKLYWTIGYNIVR